MFLLGFILLLKITYAQPVPPFELTKDGVEPIIVTVDSLTASQLYMKTLNWIKEYYKTPVNALKVDNKNEQVKIEHIDNNTWYYNTPDTTFYYVVEYFFYVDFEDNKIRMSFEFGNTWNRSEYGTHSYCINYKKLWKQNGEVHTIYKETKPGIDQLMNELSLSLISYLKDNKNNLEEEKQSDWLRLRHKTKAKVIY